MPDESTLDLCIPSYGWPCTPWVSYAVKYPSSLTRFNAFGQSMRFGKTALLSMVGTVCIIALFGCSPVTVGRCFDSRINGVPPISPTDNKLHVELFNKSRTTVVYVRLDVSGTNEDGLRVVIRKALPPRTRIEYISPIDPSQYDYYIVVKGEVDCSVREVRFADGGVWHGATDGSGHPLFSRLLHAVMNP